jgi:hypothetical protein
MQMKIRIVMIVLALLFVGSNVLTAQKFKYIGADKCKMCHNKPATGDQYNKWKTSLHAQSMKSLSNAKSLEYAKKNNIADPAKEASCLKCHSTAASVDKSLIATLTPTEGVSCESCHGPGSGYKSATIMKDKKYAMENGLIEPNQKVCEKCHNKENPFYKPFDFVAYSAKIAHPNPALKK